MKLLFVLLFTFNAFFYANAQTCAGKDLNFNGTSNQYVSIPNNSNVNLNANNFTISAWLFTRSSSGLQNILFHGNGCNSYASWYLGIGGGENNTNPGKIVFGFRNTNGGNAAQIVSPSNAPYYSWVHVAIVFDGASLIMYLNGSAVNVVNLNYPVTGVPWNSPENLYIGADPGCGGRNFYNGIIDELQIFSSTNSESVVHDWYNKPLTSAHPRYNSLTAYFKFDEGSGTTTTDSKNSLTGTLLGAPVWFESGAPLTAAAGSIGNAHTVPFPQEKFDDYISTLTSSEGGYKWETSTDSTNWTAAPESTNTPMYKIPNFSTNTYIRRATLCPAKTVTNPVLIKVFNQSNVNNGSPSKNGSITGYVRSKSNAGVAGITVYAQKNAPLKGSPQSYVYSVVTDGDGKYNFQNIFYGDKDNGDPVTVNFTITPFKTNHSFRPGFYSPQPLSYNDYSVLSGPNFTDTTVLSVIGNVFQQCRGCLDNSSIPTPVNTITAGVDSAKITGGDLPAYTAFSGNYATTIQDQGTKTFTPSYKNHRFSPAFTVQNITDNVTGMNFTDTTTYTISGRLTAGGGDYIGQAVLLFTDTAAGRAVTFRKRDTTRINTGAFSIRLPSRKYKVSIESFTPVGLSTDSAFVSANALGTFFNTLVSRDSLVANIDTSNAILNLIYHRPPVLQIVGLRDTTCPNIGVVFKQNVAKTFVVNVFEGPVSKGLKVTTNDNTNAADSLSAGDSIRIVTDIQDITGTASPETLRYRLKKGIDTATLIPGVPNIASPFNKVFQLYYTDKYGRAAVSVSRNVVVTGIQSPPQTFVTTSPTVPLLILHRPPGDLSYSFWEQTKSIETAMRLSVATSDNISGYLQAKIGAKFSAGIGVQIETEVIGAVNAAIGTTVTNTTENEAIITNSTTTKYTTKQGGILGSAGDVYIGGAINFKYGVSNVVQFNNSCALNLTEQLIVAPDSIKTIYSYSEDHITNTIMPALTYFVQQTAGAQKAYYQNQLNVWQQVIDNNNLNKQNAAFVENRSFDGNAGGVEVSKTFSKTNSNTIAFNMELEQSIATTIGASVNGSGVEGGVTVGFKMETGNSTTNSLTTSTTTGYFMGDKDGGDYYSVNVKTDPVYGTPAFSLVAGTSSCPPEPGAQSRDNSQVLITRPVRTNISNGQDTALFTVNLVNKSESREARTYLLNATKASYNGIVVSVDGINLGSTVPIPYTLAYLESRQITIKLQRNDPSLYSYEGIELTLTDNCDGSVQAKNYITANFSSTCGAINLVTPEDGWVISTADNNVLPVTFSGYTLNSIDSVTLEYARAGSSTWNKGFSMQRFQITNPATTTNNWSTASLPDSLYKLRLKLTCTNGTVVYTPRVNGVIDRKAPLLLGKPQPSDDSYVIGDEISFTYTENINNNVGSSNVVMRRLSNNTVIATSVSAFGNKIIIVPQSNIAAGDSIMVTVNGISDIYGNTRTFADTSRFFIGTPPVAANASPVKVYMVTPALLENAAGKMEVHFKLPAPAAKLTKVYFSISGTATNNVDYVASMDTLQVLVDTSNAVFQPVYGYYNGSQGYIYINKNAREAVLKLDPIEDSVSDPDETIIISLNAGGDYKLTDSTTATATILVCSGIASVSAASNPVCNGATTTLTANGVTGPNAVVRWYTGPNGTGTLLATGPTLTNRGAGAYYARVTSDCGNPVEKSITITSAALNTWTGLVNTNWSTAGNWSCNTVPAAGANVVIPANVPNAPVVMAPFTVGNLNLNTVLSLNGQTVTINGALTGTGTITGSATSNLIINGNAGILKFTIGAAILHQLQINTTGSAIVNQLLTITGRQ